jgi:hypothetical protein
MDEKNRLSSIKCTKSQKPALLFLSARARSRNRDRAITIAARESRIGDRDWRITRDADHLNRDPLRTQVARLDRIDRLSGRRSVAQQDADRADTFHGTRITRISPHGTRIARVTPRGADRADHSTGRGSRGSLHRTRISAAIVPARARRRGAWIRRRRTRSRPSDTRQSPRRGGPRARGCAQHPCTRRPPRGPARGARRGG